MFSLCMFDVYNCQAEKMFIFLPSYATVCNIKYCSVFVESDKPSDSQICFSNWPSWICGTIFSLYKYVIVYGPYLDIDN